MEGHFERARAACTDPDGPDAKAALPEGVVISDNEAFDQSGSDGDQRSPMDDAPANQGQDQPMPPAYRTRCRAGEPCPTCIHANEHMIPHGISNIHTALGNQSKVYDASMLVAAKPTINTYLRKCISVTSTHTSVNNCVLTSRRPMDAVKWHSTHMTVTISHLHTSLESMIVPMLPSLKPDFVQIFADDL